MQDVKFAVRSLMRQPGFALSAVTALALGIGATVAIFSTVNAAMLRPLPFPNPGDLYALYAPPTDGRFGTGRDSPVEIKRLHDPNVSILRAAGSTTQSDAVILRDDGTSMPIVLYAVTDGFFDLFGLPMAAGRAFTPQEHVPGGAQGAVISYRLWRTVYGGDPAIVGKSVRFLGNGIPIVGVAHPDFNVPAGADLWLNAIAPPSGPGATGHGFDGYVRLKPGTNLKVLEEQMAVVMQGLAKDFGPADTNRRYEIKPLVTAMVGDLRATLLVILGASAMLLLLAIVNVTNLLVARGAIRGREMALRVALGAGRARIARQLLTESLVLAAAGALAGLVLAYAGIRLLLTYGGSTLPRLQTIPFDGRVLLFVLATTIVTGVLVGFAPVLRLGGASLKTLMNESGRSSTGSGSAHRLLRAMVVAEIALAIALVAGAGWLFRSFANLQRADGGFIADKRLVVDILPAQRFGKFEQIVAWSAETLDNLRAVPGVESAATTATFPLRGQDNDSVLYVGVQGDFVDPDHPKVARVRRVSTRFFETMGIRLLAGRTFTDDDRAETAPVAIVSKAFVRRYLEGHDPLSVKFAAGYPTVPPEPFYTIVGVVDDVKYVSLALDADPMYYQPQSQTGYVRQVAVLKTKGDPLSVASQVRDAIHKRDPQMPVRMEPLTGVVAGSLVRQRLGMTLMMIFAITALGLAAVGIYGVISYVSSQREGEVATRMALGASPASVFWLMVGQGRTLSILGVVAGLAIAYAGGRVISSRLYEVGALDPLVLGSAGAVVLAITAVAVALPAHRASRVAPARVLHLD